MRIKKGFTLAEILIVLTVIGVLATMTVPTMTKSMDEAQYKTAYKKAYSVVSNVFGILKAEGQFTMSKGPGSQGDIYAGLVGNMEIDGYAKNALSDATRIQTLIQTSGLTTTNQGVNVVTAADNAKLESYWLVSSDNIAYKVIQPSASGTCSPKQTLNDKNGSQIAGESCVIVAIDANGLGKSPNQLEPQVGSALVAGTKAAPFKGDRFYIYIGTDGVAKGNGNTSLSGRILGDVK